MELDTENGQQASGPEAVPLVSLPLTHIASSSWLEEAAAEDEAENEQNDNDDDDPVKHAVPPFIRDSNASLRPAAPSHHARPTVDDHTTGSRHMRYSFRAEMLRVTPSVTPSQPFLLAAGAMV
jgi:hypothetical protein